MAGGILFLLYRIKKRDIDHRLAQGDYGSSDKAKGKELKMNFKLTELLKY